MSGAKRLAQAENGGLAQVTNEDLRENGVCSSEEKGEGDGEEK